MQCSKPATPKNVTMYKTTNADGGPGLKRGTISSVRRAADQILRRDPDALPQNMHLMNRLALMNLIRQLHDENRRLRAGATVHSQ